jgi:hypothetical protein
MALLLAKHPAAILVHVEKVTATGCYALSAAILQDASSDHPGGRFDEVSAEDRSSS